MNPRQGINLGGGMGTTAGGGLGVKFGMGGNMGAGATKLGSGMGMSGGSSMPKIGGGRLQQQQQQQQMQQQQMPMQRQQMPMQMQQQQQGAANPLGLQRQQVGLSGPGQQGPPQGTPVDWKKQQVEHDLKVQVLLFRDFIEDEKKRCGQIDTELKKELPDAELLMTGVRQKLTAVKSEMFRASWQLDTLRGETKRKLDYAEAVVTEDLSGGGYGYSAAAARSPIVDFYLDTVRRFEGEMLEYQEQIKNLQRSLETAAEAH